MPDHAYKSAAITHIGKVRESNQDSYLRRDEAGLWAVADGMGGHASGDLASEAVIRALENLPPEDDLDKMLEAAHASLEAANTQLASMERGGRAPGSTVVALFIRGNDGIVGWAGDSRAYRLRNQRAEQITRDHSHVQELVDEGVVAPEEAESHPMAHMLTRAVGIDAPLALETLRFDVEPGDRFLLCSDGLSRLVSLGEIESHMNEGDPQDVVDRLLQATLEGGAPDNVTVLVVECPG